MALPVPAIPDLRTQLIASQYQNKVAALGSAVRSLTPTPVTQAADVMIAAIGGGFLSATARRMAQGKTIGGFRADGPAGLMAAVVGVGMGLESVAIAGGGAMAAAASDYLTPNETKLAEMKTAIESLSEADRGTIQAQAVAMFAGAAKKAAA